MHLNKSTTTALLICVFRTLKIYFMLALKTLTRHKFHVIHIMRCVVPLLISISNV